MAMSFRGSGGSGDRLYRTASLPNINSAYTAMAWVRPEVDLNDFSVVWAFTGSNWDNTNSYEYIGSNGDGLSLHVDAHPGMGSWTGDPLVLDEWHHLALVREAAAGPINVYLNGELAGTFSDADATGRESVQRFDVAGFGSANYSPFHGSLAYLRIWSTALSQSEVQAELDAMTAVKTANLYGDYPLSGGVGVRNLDISGADNHLTELGAPADVDPPTIGVSSFARTKSAIGQLTLSTGDIGTTFDVELGFEPKLVILNWNPATGTAEPNPAISANLVTGFGAFVSDTRRFAVATFESNGAATTVNNRVQSNDCCVIVSNASDAVAGKADINAITATGFQLIIDTAFAAEQRVNYIALGGDGLENVAIDSVNLGSVAGNLDITGLTFQPNAVIFIGAGLGTINNTVTADSGLSIGAADGTRQWVISGGSNDLAATSQTGSYGIDSECYALVNASVASMGNRYSFVEFLSDGFRINRIIQPITNRYVFFIALKAERVRVDSLLTQTNTTTPITESLGWSPVSTLLASHAKPKSTASTLQDHHELTVGMFTSPTNRIATGARSNDNAADAVSGVAMSTAYAYVKQNSTVNAGDSSTPTSIDGAMDVQSIDADGFTLIMDDADPAQSFVGYISFGTAYDHSLSGEASLTFTATADLTVSTSEEGESDGVVTNDAAEQVVMHLHRRRRRIHKHA